MLNFLKHDPTKTTKWLLYNLNKQNILPPTIDWTKEFIITELQWNSKNGEKAVK